MSSISAVRHIYAFCLLCFPADISGRPYYSTEALSIATKERTGGPGKTQGLRWITLQALWALRVQAAIHPFGGKYGEIVKINPAIGYSLRAGEIELVGVVENTEILT